MADKNLSLEEALAIDAMVRQMEQGVAKRDRGETPTHMQGRVHIDLSTESARAIAAALRREL